MGTSNVGSGGIGLPTSLFNVSTFGTLGGCATVTWIVANVLSGIVNLELKIVGLVVSIVVAYVAVFLSGGIDKRRYVVAFFNGFLIYFIVVGATALTPLVNPDTGNATTEHTPSIANNLTRPWFPDTNMVIRNGELENEVTSLTYLTDDIKQALKDVDSSTTVSTIVRELSTETRDTLDIPDTLLDKPDTSDVPGEIIE